MPWAHLSSPSFKCNAQPFHIFIFQLVGILKRVAADTRSLIGLQQGPRGHIPAASIGSHLLFVSTVQKLISH